MPPAASPELLEVTLRKWAQGPPARSIRSHFTPTPTRRAGGTLNAPSRGSDSRLPSAVQDMRKSFDTAEAVARDFMGEDPEKVAVFVFLGKSSSRIKLLLRAPAHRDQQNRRIVITWIV